MNFLDLNWKKSCLYGMTNELINKYQIQLLLSIEDNIEYFIKDCRNEEYRFDIFSLSN